MVVAEGAAASHASSRPAARCCHAAQACIRGQPERRPTGRAGHFRRRRQPQGLSTEYEISVRVAIIAGPPCVRDMQGRAGTGTTPRSSGVVVSPWQPGLVAATCSLSPSCLSLSHCGPPPSVSGHCTHGQQAPTTRAADPSGLAVGERRQLQLVCLCCFDRGGAPGRADRALTRLRRPDAQHRVPRACAKNKTNT